ncbi:hypothetical protein FO519_008519 [Halicephalobus sp. NKZ332]|nr:hypothetical protein FO519_008519 [Halicephalobus sp. NKZ332]
MPSLLANSFNPLSSFRKKTKSFRLKSRQIFSESCSSTPVSYNKKKLESIDEGEKCSKKAHFIDSEISRFFSKFKRSDSVNHEVSLTSMKHVYSTPKIPKFSGFKDFFNISSTKCLLEVLKRLPSEDLMNFRLINKSFDKVIQTHAFELQKKKLYRLKLFENESGKLGLRKFGTSSTTPLMKLEKIDKALRHIEAKNFDFYNLTITGKTIKYLHRGIKYRIKDVKFFNCVFHITIFNPSDPPPKTFILNNCATFMNSKTLFAAISAYCNYSESEVFSQNLPYFYSWTFGRMNESREQIMDSISPILESLHVEDYSNDNRLRLILKVREDFPPLMLDVHLRPFVTSLWNFEEDLKEQKKYFSDDEDIDFDDSSSEEEE